VSDYLGTPQMMFDEHGKKVWEGVLDIYGRLQTSLGNKADIPFRYQGQYEDVETGLYYNRFRYYDPEIGRYLSKDPVGLMGGMNLFSYVSDTNTHVDFLGLTETYLTRLGNFGERKVMERLNSSGNYTHVFQIQNASNNGIDIVAKTPDGKYDVFEVKTSAAGQAPRIKGDQLEPDNFVSSRLQTAGSNESAFRISRAKTEDISRNLANKYLVEVDVGRGDGGKWIVNSMTQKNWDAEAQRLRGSYH
jgi:RHS repeat-associated protein